MRDGQVRGWKVLVQFVLHLESELQLDRAVHQMDPFLEHRWVDIQSLGMMWVSLHKQDHMKKV